MRSVIAAILLLATNASMAGAYEAIYLAANPDPYVCESANATPGSVVELYVTVGRPSFTGAQFRVSQPGCPGVILADWSAGNNLAIGDPESGIWIAMTQCVGNEQVVLTLSYLVTEEVDCCEIALLPPPGGGISVFDCNFTELPARAIMNGFISTNPEGCTGTFTPPYDPSPADGATNVPVEFSWPGYKVDSPHLVCAAPCYPEIYELYLGTDPDPPLVYHYMKPYDPWGPLEPATTYYWRIIVTFCGFYPESPVYSFTTENATPVETSTWGAVKALYR